jgi:hypothetical protein
MTESNAPSIRSDGALNRATTSCSGLDTAIPGADSTQPWLPLAPEQRELPDIGLPDESFFLDDSLFTFGDTMTPNFGPVEWYDLLAEDFQGQTQNSRWNFDITSLSRRQSPRPTLVPGAGDVTFDDADTQPIPIVHKPWNTEQTIQLKQEEVIYFEHFIYVVAPVLDLFDPEKHFATVVPHLALRNIGLLKSLLAVGACHMDILHPQSRDSEAPVPTSPSTTASISGVSVTTSKIAEQYYYETLQYLSQNLLYQAYTDSLEILATATMISTYEVSMPWKELWIRNEMCADPTLLQMYGTVSNSDHSNWDRHLRGAFWIQRTMGVSGESSDGLQRAIWWAWMRQDVWAAFRTGRPTLTIHQPKVPMSALSSNELAKRIIYIAAKCVQFAATPKEGDIAGYIEAGETLMRMLDTWKRYLPTSFEPIPIAPSHSSPSLITRDDEISPIWIHPPAHAAAVQTYHFARIIMILNQPSTGGLSMYQTRFRLLRESTTMICGIAIAQQSQTLASAFVSFQALYAGKLKQECIAEAY